MPPEDAAGAGVPATLHARDMYAFGKLCLHLLEPPVAAPAGGKGTKSAARGGDHGTGSEVENDDEDGGDEDTEDDAPPGLADFLAHVRGMLVAAADPAARPPAAAVQAHPFFARNALVQACVFLDAMTLQPLVAKERFFAGLAARLAPLPRAAVARHVLPRLLTRVMLTEAAMAPLLPRLFTPRRAAADQGDDIEEEGLVPVGAFRRCVHPPLRLAVAGGVHGIDHGS